MRDGGAAIAGCGIWFVGGLARRGAQGMEGSNELALVHTGFAHRQPHAPDAHGDHGADLQEPQPDRVGAGACQTRTGEPDASQGMHQHVGGRGQPQTQLVGAERRGREPVSEQIQLRLLDAVLALPAGAVPIPESLTLSCRTLHCNVMNYSILA